MPGSSVPASKSFSKISEPRPIETHHTQKNYFEETTVQKSETQQLTQHESGISSKVTEVKVRESFSPKSAQRKSKKSSKASSNNMSPSMAYAQAVKLDQKL